MFDLKLPNCSKFLFNIYNHSIIENFLQTITNCNAIALPKYSLNYIEKYTRKLHGFVTVKQLIKLVRQSGKKFCLPDALN